MKKMLKKIFAIGLALIIFCSSQSHVYAALNTGHSVSVRFMVLYVDSSFNIGYNYGASESTTFICQYSVSHSDTAYNNHTIAENDIKTAANRLSLDEGYQITGWTKSASKNPTINPLKTSGSTACNKGDTIYLVAKKSNPKITYTLNYNANGGMDGPATQTENSYGNSYAFTVSNTVPTRDGYDFLGWADSQSATKVTYVGGDSITLTQSAPTKTIYAVWKLKDTPKQKYTVTYTDGVEDEVVFTDQTTRVNEGEETPAFVGTPKRDGYVFAGWNPDVAKTVTKDVTYTAVWKEDKNNNGVADEDEEKYTVTYTDGVENEEVFADQSYSDLLSGIATPKYDGTPARKGYVFAGWNPDVAKIVTKDVTYTAVWKEDKNNNGVADEDEEKYTVTYTDGVENEEVFADQSYSDLLSGTQTPVFDGTPTRKGYVFKGWNPAVAETVTQNVTYTAVWEKDKNNNEGNNSDENNNNENNDKKDDDKENNIVVTDDTNKPNKDNQNDKKDNQDKKVENKTNNPTTGDDSQLGLMLGTILLSASGLFLLQRRKEEN